MKAFDIDARRAFRIKEKLPLTWKEEDSNRKGECKLHNISTTGMMVEMSSENAPALNSVLNFDTIYNQDFIPTIGRIAWSRQKPFQNNRFFCGVEFVEPADEKVSKLKDRVQKVARTSIFVQRVENTVGVIALVIMFGMTLYIVKQSSFNYQNISNATQMMISSSQTQASNYQTYVERYNVTKAELIETKAELESTKILYQESQVMLGNVTKELESTKAILAETENLLSQLTGQNSELQQKIGNMVDVEKVTAMKNELEGKITNLETEKVQMTAELNRLMKRVSYLEGEIGNIDEGRELVALYKTKMKLVKGKIKGYLAQAKQQSIAAAKERDKLKSALGNNGYLMKNGQAVESIDFSKVDWASIETKAATSTVAASSEAPAVIENSPIKVDVQFVK